MAKAARPFVIIGTPGDRRITLFQEALTGLDLPPASVIAYADLLENRVDLDAAIPGDAIVRIESPGKDWAVNRALALRGKETRYSLSTELEFPFPDEAGDYIPSWAWYAGFREMLEKVQVFQLCRSDLVCMNHIPDIRLMFDKAACRTYMLKHHLTFPRSSSKPADSNESDPIWSARYMLKARYGSSGTGIVAVQQMQVRGQVEERLHTTLALKEDTLINTRRIRRVMGINALQSDAAIQRWLQCELVTSETWIPKATVPGGAFDLRIVMIAGRMRHIVVRVSQSPITNLHLLNKRGDLDEVRRRLSDSAWKRIEETCEQVAALFPKSLYMGIDLLITPTWNKHYVLEVNAFGDLLPNLLHEGDDTYTAEIREILKRD